jgi:hypothetical protein
MPSAGVGTWLQPSDAVISKAIDDGFSDKKLPKDARYHRILNWIKPGLDARIEVDPPLMCALSAGQQAHDKLQAKPTVDSVKSACLNAITVIIVHYSQALRANWACIIEKDGVTLQPAIKTLDSDPQVVTYYPGGLSTEDVAGYRYAEVYTFNIPKEWSSSAILTYANEQGVHRSLNLDFSSFIKDVAGR